MALLATALFYHTLDGSVPHPARLIAVTALAICLESALTQVAVDAHYHSTQVKTAESLLRTHALNRGWLVLPRARLLGEQWR